MAFLSGAIPIPAPVDSVYPAWERCNTLIMSWILNSVSPSIAQSIIYLERASNIWVDLRKRFSHGDLLRVAELQEEVYAFKQGTRSVSEYFTSLKSVWEELDNLPPLSACSCSAKLYHSQDFTICFLKGLDERYAMVCSQILLLDPLPLINRVFSMVIQHERQQVGSSLPTDEPNLFVNAAYKTRSGGSPGPSGAPPTRTGASTKQCTYCHRSGHTVEECYSKHGYPPGHPRYPGQP
jgi:hypothetical protein